MRNFALLSFGRFVLVFDGRICEYTFHIVQQLYTHGMENGLDVARKHLKTSTPHPRPFRPIMRGPMMRVLSTSRQAEIKHHPQTTRHRLHPLLFDVRTWYSGKVFREFVANLVSEVSQVLCVLCCMLDGLLCAQSFGVWKCHIINMRGLVIAHFCVPVAGVESWRKVKSACFG